MKLELNEKGEKVGDFELNSEAVQPLQFRENDFNSNKKYPHMEQHSCLCYCICCVYLFAISFSISFSRCGYRNAFNGAYCYFTYSNCYRNSNKFKTIKEIFKSINFYDRGGGKEW